jgi:hypothetical protein
VLLYAYIPDLLAPVSALQSAERHNAIRLFRCQDNYYVGLRLGSSDTYLHPWVSRRSVAWDHGNDAVKKWKENRAPLSQDN